MQHGRPQLFPDGRQISVLVSGDDYQILTGLVNQERLERPGFSFGDLLRGYIREALDKRPRRRFRNHSSDPKDDRIRRLHFIARSARRLAQEEEQMAGR